MRAFVGHAGDAAVDRDAAAGRPDEIAGVHAAMTAVLFVGRYQTHSIVIVPFNRLPRCESHGACGLTFELQRLHDLQRLACWRVALVRRRVRRAEIA